MEFSSIQHFQTIVSQSAQAPDWRHFSPSKILSFPQVMKERNFVRENLAGYLTNYKFLTHARLHLLLGYLVGVAVEVARDVWPWGRTNPDYREIIKKQAMNTFYFKAS